ncbi:acetylglutamate kinase [Rodentibacter trehalosifermentans]|uniref:Acetylglutamate kinase n=1 Tax=Rodentibacter trehalosifermentans TaxID=1908263 RepID=A0A1V3IVP5_9PAST|nr:acetylglutamate kinase [Rodentibacter trehalosifermentans]OOF46351.1 acetylglutamate kinase [Rodentibacter trehalosifermentans]
MKNLIVIKMGGNAGAELTPIFYQQLKQWQAAGKAVLLVHGGGNKISEYCEKLQLPVMKKDGIRITDAATLEITQMVLLGLIQPQILQQLASHQISAMGLNTITNASIQGEEIDPIAFGAVGKITHIHTALFETLLQDYVGVVAPLAQNQQGGRLNINGDNAAAEIATLLQAEALYLVTDVPGVLKEGRLISTITPTTAQQLQAENVIGCGMKPKINAAFYALEKGVPYVKICSNTFNEGTIFKED